MSKILSNLKKRPVPKASKRVGRGYGSGKGGHASGKGNKGQKARTGGKEKLWFEGGQTPLIKRMPYSRGFKNHDSTQIYAINLYSIEKLFEKNNEIDREILFKNGLLKKNATESEIKILGKGKINKKIIFKGFLYSKTAREKILSAGGTVE